MLEKHKAVRRWVKRLRKEKGVESLRQMLSQVQQHCWKSSWRLWKNI